MDENLKDILETVNFIKDYMMTHMLTKQEGVTKDELPELVRSVMRDELKPIEDRLTSVESKIADQYAMVH